MSLWTLQSGGWRDGPQTNLTPLATWKLSAKRKDPSTLSFEIDGLEPLILRELVDDLWLWCDGKVWFRGRFIGTSDSFDDSHDLSVNAIDYRGALARRMCWDDWTLVRSNVDPALDAWQLVQQAQAEPGGNLGIVRGVSPSDTVAVAEIKHEAGGDVAGEIDADAKFDPGFDWDVTPFSEMGLQFDVWRPGRGRVTDVVLTLGPMGTPSRSVDSTRFANAVRLPGGTDAASSQLPAVRREVSDIADRPEGRWDLAIGDAQSATTPGAGAALADKALADAQALQPAYTFDLDGDWSPADFWLGDTVTLQIRSGRLLVDEQLSVEAIDVSGDPDSPQPKVSVTLGAYTVAQAKLLKLRAIDRTLAKLNRH